MDTLKVKVVRTDGKVDVNATLAEASNALVAFAAGEDADIDTIADAVEKAWDEYPTAKRMNMTALLSYTHGFLDVAPEKHNEVNERIKNYVQSSDKFIQRKGAKGGVFRLDRLSAEERTALQEKQTAKAA